MKRGKLIDRKTLIEAAGVTAKVNAVQILTYNINDKFAQLLREFRDLTVLNTNRKPANTDVTHHITTSGAPVFARPRRLVGEKLDAAKKESQYLMEN